MPKVGDTDLTCGECGRRMSLRGDLNGHRAATILDGYERRHGTDAGQAFREAFQAAQRAAPRTTATYGRHSVRSLSRSV